MLEGLKRKYPDYPIVLTFFSPSGYEIRKDYPLADKVLYLPIDSNAHAKEFIKKVNPALVLWIKYEYWYYFLNQLHQQRIPVLLISGIFRLSQPFFKFYGKFWKRMLNNFNHLFVQDENSKQLLAAIGFSNEATVAGDTRFDRVLEITHHPKPLPEIAAFCNHQKVIVAGSTWDEDEEVWAHYTRKHPEIKFIIAPHEVDADNIRRIKMLFPNACLYSSFQPEKTNCHILIIDNIGMLSKLYAYAHITYIGGGFRDSGIHNTLEAAAYGKPVIFGPVYQKFREAVMLIETGAAVSILSALELEKLVDILWSDINKIQEMGTASYTYVKENAGATEKIITYIQENRLLIN